MNYEHQNRENKGDMAGTKQTLCACEPGIRWQLAMAKDEDVRCKKHLPFP
jgi:hypothetical protein